MADDRWERRSGLAAVTLATELLHRVRLADDDAGVWEAADVQWWWRTARQSDSIDQRFVIDADGPTAAALATKWPHAWGIDPIALRGSVGALPDLLSESLNVIRAVIPNDEQASTRIETLARDDDPVVLAVLRRAGFSPTDERGGITWLDAARRPAIAPLPRGLVVVDRAAHPDGPHPVARRSGSDAEGRLLETSLYDPALDLSILDPAGHVVAYGLFWFDTVSRVGLVEPMRVEDAWQRRGIARSLLATGIDRLARRGAARIKVGWGSVAGRALYLGAGFVETATTTTFVRSLG